MKLMEEVFFSFTFGGETLSLAAAKATLLKLRREPVVQTLAQRGERILRELPALIERHRLSHVFSTSGHPTWTFLTVRDAGPVGMYDIKTLLTQELLQKGILTIGTHNLSYAHTDEDIAALLAAYDRAFAIIGAALREGDLRSRLRCKPLVPLFKVR
jgi:glutamate-1-semialdehyde 2,1-aminomutase